MDMASARITARWTKQCLTTSPWPRPPTGEEKLVAIARELVKAVRRNLSVDWTARDDVQATLRSTIKRLLARRGYPPDEERDAIDNVIKQLETFADEWSPIADG